MYALRHTCHDIDDVWSGGSKKDGDYMLMSSAIAAGLYYPNCKDSHTTYFEGLTKYNGNLQRSLYFNSDDDVTKFMKDYIIDEFISYKEYISTTKGETYNPDGQVQIYIKDAKNGVDISTYNKAEDEVLYDRNSTFKVSNIVEKDGKHYILLKEKEDE